MSFNYTSANFPFQPFTKIYSADIDQCFNDIKTALNTTTASQSYNLGLAASVASSALTISLKQSDGITDPTTGVGSVIIPLRSATATLGSYNLRNIIASTTITVPNGTTLGLTGSVKTYIYVYALDNSGTVELAISLDGSWDEQKLQTTTAVSGGSSTTTLYSTTSRSSVPIRLIGRLEIVEATPGTWATTPSQLGLVPMGPSRQSLIGTPQTSDGSTSSATFANFTNQPTVTFTVQRTKRYKVSCTAALTVSNDGASGQITIGSPAAPNLFANQDGAFTAQTGELNTISCFAIWDLTAGSSVTFNLKGKVDSGSTLTLKNSYVSGGIFLVVEEWN